MDYSNVPIRGERREKKRQRRYKMKVSGRSVRLLNEIIRKDGITANKQQYKK